jgi:hypothetical protein
MEIYNRNTNRKLLVNQIDTAKEMIENRLNRLKMQKEMLRGGLPAEYARMLEERQMFMNPALYSYQFQEPIYYPLENPVCGEPLTLPKIELGQPLNTSEAAGSEEGLSLSDILNLLNSMNNNKPNQNIPVALPYQPKKKGKKKKKLSPLKKKTV